MNNQNPFIISGFADEIDPDLSNQIRVLKKLNINHLELRSAYGKNVSQFTLEEAKEIKVILNSAGIHVSSIGSPIGKVSINDDFQPHLKLLEHVIEVAKIFDTKYIRMFSFFIPKNEDPSTYKDEVIRRLKLMRDLAISHDVILLHENEKDIYGDTVDRCKILMKELYMDNFKFVFDFANFIQCNQDTLYGYEQLAPYIAYIHIKDARNQDKAVVLPGYGDGHLPEIINKVKESGYQGFLSIEPHLKVFSGLNKLEQSGSGTLITNEFESGEAAFEAAAHALERLLS